MMPIALAVLQLMLIDDVERVESLVAAVLEDMVPVGT